MKCACGKESIITSRGVSHCWECFELKKKPADYAAPCGSVMGVQSADPRSSKEIHIDTNAVHSVQLCNGVPGDRIVNMTPMIAAHFIAQHPDEMGKLCIWCLHALLSQYSGMVMAAKEYAATL